MSQQYKAKPFIKWVGGKTQLIEQLDAQLPADFGNWEDVTYIEPFVGGGAMLFYMIQILQSYESDNKRYLSKSLCITNNDYGFFRTYQT